MPWGLTWLDAVLLLILVMFLVAGYRRGFWITLGTMVGLIAGAVASFFSIPLVSSWVDDPAWRWVAIIAAAVFLIVVGQAIGAGLGRWIRLRLSVPALRTADRLAGAVANTVVAAALIALLAFSASTMGVPAVTSAVSQSRVISTINKVAPDQTKSVIAQIRAAVAGAGLVPEIDQPVAPEASTPTAAPTGPPPGDSLTQASHSVVRITGTSLECGQNQTGSGFAIAPDRVVTNAHVVAGLTEPAVEQIDGAVYAGRVVHFDPERDLAVVAVDDADLPALPTGADLEDGDSAHIMGYPAGGPFSLDPAEVQARGSVPISSIYGGETGMLEIYQLHADVRQGGSGGPLLATDGTVAGVVFARSAADVAVGYAITGDEARDVFTQAEDWEQTVSTGQCIQGG